MDLVRFRAAGGMKGGGGARVGAAASLAFSERCEPREVRLRASCMGLEHG